MGQSQDHAQGLSLAPERLLSARRLLLSLAAGVISAGVAAVLGVPELAPLTGWIVAAGVALIWVWRISWQQDHLGTKRLAEAESRSRSTDAAVLLAAIASLGAVVLALVRASGNQDSVAIASVILGVLAVILSWAQVNTVFALKYARLYYKDEAAADGGIDFKQDQPPAYSDFAYLAFTVGMSFAVSETEPTNTHVRKVALMHALLSYAFGTGIVTVAVNLVTNLGQ